MNDRRSRNPFVVAITGFVIGAPSSSSGKTTAALGLMRALRRNGCSVQPAKSGPDFIDTQFHKAACGRESINLDAWAMPEALLRKLATFGVDRAGKDTCLVIEGAMGVLDGAGSSGSGSTACLAEALKVPIIMIVDASRQAHSAVLAPLGFRQKRTDLEFAGVILNRIASQRHDRTVTRAFESEGFTVFGSLPKSEALSLPSRHLGLVAAGEHSDIESFLDRAAGIVEDRIDLAALLESTPCLSVPSGPAPNSGISPLGQRMAIAWDDAFSFVYAHLVADWRRMGVDISWFSPVAR